MYFVWYTTRIDMFRTSTMGGGGGNPFIGNCPPGEYITQWYGGAGHTIDRFGAKCSDGTNLGPHGGGGGNAWSSSVSGPYKSFWGTFGDVVDNFMDMGGPGGSQRWADSCPSGAAVGIFGRAGELTNQLGIQCGPPSNWCVNNLEDPMCARVDALTLNKACATNFSETCTNRKAELTDSTMNLYCVANPTADICSCYSQVPSYIPQEMAGLAPCWNKACATTGYIPQNMRGSCPSITICRQEMGTSGDSNMLTNNVILQDCGGKTNLADPHHDSAPAVDRARTIAEVDSNIWTLEFIIIIIIIGIFAGVCVYSLFKRFFKKKESDEDADVDKHADE